MESSEKYGHMYVTFMENDDMLAVPVDDVLWVREVTQKTPKAIMPNAPAYTGEILELDGQLVTVLNLAYGGAVITNHTSKLKIRHVFGDNVFPKFSILNPAFLHGYSQILNP